MKQGRGFKAPSALHPCSRVSWRLVCWVAERGIGGAGYRRLRVPSFNSAIEISKYRQGCCELPGTRNCRETHMRPCRGRARLTRREPVDSLAGPPHERNRKLLYSLPPDLAPPPPPSPSPPPPSPVISIHPNLSTQRIKVCAPAECSSRSYLIPALTAVACRPVSLGAISSRTTVCFSLSCRRFRFASVRESAPPPPPAPSQLPPRLSACRCLPPPDPAGAAGADPVGSTGTLLATPFTYEEVARPVEETEGE